MARDVLPLEMTSVAIFVAVVLAIIVSKLLLVGWGRRYRLPPGPRPIPIFGNWLQIGDDLNHRKLAELSKQYGDVYLLRMGQRNVVVVSSPELAREVLYTKGVGFGSRMRNIVYDVFTGKGQDMVFTEYGEHWRKMRRIMTVPFFTSKVVQHNHRAWEEEVGRVVEDMRANPRYVESATTGVVLRRRLQLMMYNNIYRVMFGRRFEGEDDPLFNKVRFLNGERGRLTQSFEYNYGDFIPVLKPFVRAYLKVCEDVKKTRLKLFKDSFVDVRRKVRQESEKQTDEGARCGIDHILDAEQRGEIKEDNVLYIVENMNVAALETTLWSIEWAVAELVNNANIQNKLRKEMESVLGPGVPLTEPDTHRLPYLQSIVKETIRLRSPVPFLVPHTNLKDETLGGYHIPAGTKILVNAWWIANDPRHWKQPHQFRPERFLEEEANVEANGNDFRYLPFGAGRRACPGIVMALPVIALTVGRLVQNFELLAPPGQSKIDTTEKGGQFSLQILNHYKVVLKPLPSY